MSVDECNHPSDIPREARLPVFTERSRKNIKMNVHVDLLIMMMMMTTTIITAVDIKLIQTAKRGAKGFIQFIHNPQGVAPMMSDLY